MAGGYPSGTIEPRDEGKGGFRETGGWKLTWSWLHAWKFLEDKYSNITAEQLAGLGTAPYGNRYSGAANSGRQAA